MQKTTLTLIILLIISQTGITAQAHEVTSCGITEIIKSEQSTIPENYIAGNPINLEYSFTTLNNTPIQIVTNISQAEIGTGEWIVSISIDGEELYVKEERAGNFNSDETVLVTGTHEANIRITSLPYIKPAQYVISSVLASTPCVPVKHTHESSSTSGGSGSAGVVSTECFNNVQLKETRENNLRYGQYVPFSFTSDIPVYEVDVKGLRNDNEVTIRVEQLVNLSCKLIEKPQGGIYRYINIFSGVQQDGVLIKFKISNGWLTGGTIVLVRWQDGSWKDLPTTITGSDKRFTYYEADSTGFSSFAIVERGGAKPPKPAPQVTVTAGQVQPMAQVPFVSEIAREVGVRDLKGYVLFILFIILILGAGTMYIITKRCKK